MISTRLLYIGSLNPHSNSFRRFTTIQHIGIEADAIDTDPYLMMRYFSSFQHHLNIGPGITQLNKAIRKAVSSKQYDVILVDNKPYLTAKTLHAIKQISPSVSVANLLTDDPFGRYTRSWRLLKKTAQLYDLFFVQRAVNVEELKAIGAKKVDVCYRSFDPAYNRPMQLDAADRARYGTTVGFIGSYEAQRAEYIAFLIEHGIAVSVTGNDFPGGQYWKVIEPFYKGGSVYKDEYIKTLNGMEIALHFLRRGNRDEQDSRTFEIPASKVFMVAERSKLHEQLFKENEEAVFFESKEELLEKVKYYLDAPLERERIAQNAYQRCLNSGYTHEARMRFVISQIMHQPTKPSESVS